MSCLMGVRFLKERALHVSLITGNFLCVENWFGALFVLQRLHQFPLYAAVGYKLDAAFPVYFFTVVYTVVASSEYWL